MPDCALDVAPIRVEVDSTGNGFAVRLISSDTLVPQLRSWSVRACWSMSEAIEPSRALRAGPETLDRSCPVELGSRLE